MTLAHNSRPKDAAWVREKGCPFNHAEREDYAQARAKGGTIKAAANLVGIGVETAYKWEKNPEMRARTRELRQGATNFVGVSTAWIVNQLRINVEEARNDSCYKASNEALKLMHTILTGSKDLAAQAARAIEPGVRPEEIQKRLRESFQEPPILSERADTEEEVVDVESVEEEAQHDGD